MFTAWRLIVGAAASNFPSSPTWSKAILHPVGRLGYVSSAQVRAYDDRALCRDIGTSYRRSLRPVVKCPYLRTSYYGFMWVSYLLTRASGTTPGRWAPSDFPPSFCSLLFKVAPAFLNDIDSCFVIAILFDCCCFPQVDWKRFCTRSSWWTPSLPRTSWASHRSVINEFDPIQRGRFISPPR